MTTLSKLQSEAVKKFDILVFGQIFVFPNNIKKTTGNDGYGHNIVGTAINNETVKQFLSDQIQKAYEEGYISGIKDEKILGNKTFDLSIKSKRL